MGNGELAILEREILQVTVGSLQAPLHIQPVLLLGGQCVPRNSHLPLEAVDPVGQPAEKPAMHGTHGGRSQTPGLVSVVWR